MTSHYRHRRDFDPGGITPVIEPGEIAVNTANRQAAVGDADPASPGAPLALIAVRFFDARAQYAAGDFVVQAAQIYKANAAVAPGAFDAADWTMIGDMTLAVAKTGDTMSGPLVLPGDPTLDTQAATKHYVDSHTASVTANFLPLSGGTLTGALQLPIAAPVAATQAVNKQYVDNAVGGAGGASAAINVSYAPSGNITSTNVQAAISELDSEKAALYAPAFVGPPPTVQTNPPANDNGASVPSTSWFAGQASNAVPQMSGVGSAGVSLRFARDDHIHPLSSAAAPLDSPAFTGTPTAPTAAPGTSTTQLATTEFVMTNPATTLANGVVTFIKMAASAIATVGDFLANASNKILTADRVWAAAAPVALTDAAGVTPNFSQGIDFVWIVGAAGRTLNNPSNMKLGQKGLIYLVQPSGGGASITMWGSFYKFGAGQKPTLTATPNAVDVISYAVKSGTEVECFFVGGMA